MNLYLNLDLFTRFNINTGHKTRTNSRISETIVTINSILVYYKLCVLNNKFTVTKKVNWVVVWIFLGYQ